MIGCLYWLNSSIKYDLLYYNAMFDIISVSGAYKGYRMRSKTCPFQIFCEMRATGFRLLYYIVNRKISKVFSPSKLSYIHSQQQQTLQRYLYIHLNDLPFRCTCRNAWCECYTILYRTQSIAAAVSLFLGVNCCVYI